MKSPRKPKHYGSTEDEKIRVRSYDFTALEQAQDPKTLEPIPNEYYSIETVADLLDKTESTKTKLPRTLIPYAPDPNYNNIPIEHISRPSFAYIVLNERAENFHYERQMPNERQMAAPLARLLSKLEEAERLLFDPKSGPPSIPLHFRRLLLEHHPKAAEQPSNIALDSEIAGFMGLTACIRAAYLAASEAPDAPRGIGLPVELDCFISRLFLLYCDLFGASNTTPSKEDGPAVRFVLVCLQKYPFDMVPSSYEKMRVGKTSFLHKDGEGKLVLSRSVSKGKIHSAIKRTIERIKLAQAARSGKLLHF